MTIRLTPVVDGGQWLGRWDVTDDAGTLIGGVYVPGGFWPRCVAVTASGVEITGPTFASTVTALAGIAEHAAGYVLVEEPGGPAPEEAPRYRVIPEAEQSPIRVDEATSTPIAAAPAPAPAPVDPAFTDLIRAADWVDARELTPRR